MKTISFIFFFHLISNDDPKDPGFGCVSGEYVGGDGTTTLVIHQNMVGSDGGPGSHELGW